VIQENHIKAKLETIGVSADVFCTLGKISHSKWSRALRGVENFNGDTIVRLSQLADELTGLARDAEPYILSFKNAESVARLLEWRRVGLRLIPIPVGSESIVAQFESTEKGNEKSLVNQ
jgi:hypothetical protein